MFKNSSSSFGQSQLQDFVTLRQMKNFTRAVAELDAAEKSFHHLLQPLKKKCFNGEFSSIKELYALLYPRTLVTHISRFYQVNKQIVVNNEEYLSSNSRSERSATVAACWAGDVGINSYGEAPLRIGLAQSFFLA